MARSLMAAAAGIPIRLGLALLVMCGLLLSVARADESPDANAARLQKMTVEEKAALSKKKGRFDELPPEEQQRLRELHVSIAGDPEGPELSGTVKRYSQWLSTLSRSDRSAVLDERDPAKRVAKIKELVQAQEERRFREFVRDFTENLEDADRDKFFNWFGEFVERHKELLIKRMPDDIKRRYKEADDSAKRRQLMVSWSFQYRERESETPVPSPEEVNELVNSLSEKSAKPFAAPEQRQARVITFMRAAAFSRNAPPVSRDELEKFYHKMAKDDPRRAALENLDGDTLMRELQKMWNDERWRSRIGRGDGRGSAPGPRPDGPGPDRDRSSGGKRPPP